MSRVRAPHRRCLLVWAAATLVALLLVGWLLPHLVAVIASSPPAGRFEEWLVLGCEAAAVVATTWLWVLVSLVSVEAARGTSRRHGGVPPAIRRLVLAACGAGLVGGLAAPTYAGAPPPPLAGLPLPDRPTLHAVPHVGDPAGQARAVDRGPARPAPSRTVRVATGDSLWSLAAADLPAGASTAEVDERWRSIHAANREAIGGDPDLIHPGLQLRLPPSAPRPPAT